MKSRWETMGTSPFLSFPVLPIKISINLLYVKLSNCFRALNFVKKTQRFLLGNPEGNPFKLFVSIP